jgi:hypothetical protein
MHGILKMSRDIFHASRERTISLNAAKSILLEEFKGNSSTK